MLSWTWRARHLVRPQRHVPSTSHNYRTSSPAKAWNLTLPAYLSDDPNYPKSPPPRPYQPLAHMDTSRVRLSKRMYRLLCSGEGLKKRPDGYVSLTNLLGHSEMHHVDFLMVESIAKLDSMRRYRLRYEPGAISTINSSAMDNWWICAVPENINATKRFTQYQLKRRIISPETVRMAVYICSLEEWRNSISKYGIPHSCDGYIHFLQSLSKSSILSSPPTSSSAVIIFLDLSRALSTSDIPFYLAPEQDIITLGNEMGRIPPHLFKKVERLSVKKKTLTWREGNLAPVPDEYNSPVMDESSPTSPLEASSKEGVDGKIAEPDEAFEELPAALEENREDLKASVRERERRLKDRRRTEELRKLFEPELT